MADESYGELNVFNPSKDIAKEVTLQVLIRHRDATTQAREGIIPGREDNLELSDNEKKLNRVKGLYKMISAQREMINISRPIVKYRCMVKWRKKNPTDKEQEEKPFEEEENDYSNLMLIKDILVLAEKDMIEAEKTSSTKDDYLVKTDIGGTQKYTLTEKYFEMIEGLEDNYEKIDLIMLKHKIISAGIDEDEIRSYKEQEKEAIQRIIDA